MANRNGACIGDGMEDCVAIAGCHSLYVFKQRHRALILPRGIIAEIYIVQVLGFAQLNS